MRSDYFDDLLPASVTRVTLPKKDCVTPSPDKVTCENSDLSEALRMSRMSRTKTSDTESGTENHRIPISELRELAGCDWSEIQNDPDTLNSFAHAVYTRRMRESGQRPAHYTQESFCKHCGPVWLWEGAPEHVQGCPWCFNRVQGVSVPRSGKQITLTPD